MRVITLDIETKNIFQDVNSSDPAALDMSVVCIHDSSKGDGPDSYASFLEDDLRNLWPILEEADAVVTWNGEHFDIPILNKYYSGDLSKIRSIDLMKEIVNVLGRRLKLDTVANATLGINKSGHGLDAIEWWKNGEIDKLIKYCIDDVRITKELYDHALQHGHLKYRDNATIRELKLNTAHWQAPTESALTYTLPF